MDRELTALQNEHPQLFTCQLQSLFNLLDGYDEEIAHAEVRFNLHEISERDYRTTICKINYSRRAAQKALDHRSEADAVFSRAGICDDRTSNQTPLVQPKHNSQLPSLLKQSSTNCDEVTVECNEFEAGKSPASFHSDLVESPPDIEPLSDPPTPQVPIQRARMEQPQQQPLWKQLPKHWVPLTGKETVEMLETKLDMCAAVMIDRVQADAYVQVLTSVSTEPLLSFLKNKIDAVLPLYATINPPTESKQQCCNALISRPMNMRRKS